MIIRSQTNQINRSDACNGTMHAMKEAKNELVATFESFGLKYIRRHMRKKQLIKNSRRTRTE